MKLPGLCFDATGTLIEMTASVGDVYAEVARGFGVELPAWRLDDAFRRVLRHAPPRGETGASLAERRELETEWWSERVRQTFQATDSTVRFADFPAFAAALFETYRDGSRWRTRSDVVEALDALARAGHAMAIVSNFDHRLPDILQQLGLEHYFKTVIIPSSSGSRKPDRSPFEAAAASLGLGLTELIYIGDDAPDTLEAIAAHGLRVIDATTLPSFKVLPEWVARPATLPSR
jgi:putative hydrolase of the HAD superfamily